MILKWILFNTRIGAAAIHVFLWVTAGMVRTENGLARAGPAKYPTTRHRLLYEDPENHTTNATATERARDTRHEFPRVARYDTLLPLHGYPFEKSSGRDEFGHDCLVGGKGTLKLSRKGMRLLPLQALSPM